MFPHFSSFIFLHFSELLFILFIFHHFLMFLFFIFLFLFIFYIFLVFFFYFCNCPEVFNVKRTIFFCENLIFGPWWTGGLGVAHLRVTSLSCFFFSIFLSSWKNVSSFSVFLYFQQIFAAASICIGL